MSVSLIGLGAAGRQAALLMAALGVKNLQLIDAGHVRRTDIAAEGYLDADVGRLKVQATADLCQQLAPQLEVIEEQARFSQSMAVAPIVLCCLADEAARRRIRRSVQGHCHFWGEIQTRGEVILVHTNVVGQGGSLETAVSQAITADSGLTRERASLPVATLAASLLVHQLGLYLAGATCASKLMLDLRRGFLHQESANES